MDKINDLLEKVLTLCEQGFYKDAIKCVDKANKLIPNNTNSYYDMGNVYQRIGRYDKAIKCYKKAVELDPKNNKAYYYMGNAYSGNKYDKAIKCYKKAIELDPNNVKVYYCYHNMGFAYDCKGHYDKAIECYQKVIEIGTDAVYNNYHSIGIAYSKKGDYDDAIKYYEKAIESIPNTVRGYFCYNSEGVAYRRLGNYDETTKCNEIKPDVAGIYYSMAKTYLKIGNDDKAIECFQKDIELNHDGSMTDCYYIDMGNMYQQMGKYDEAIKCCDEAIKLNTNIKYVYFYRAAAKQKLQDYLGAIKDYNKLIEIAPYYFNVFDECIEAYKLLGDDEGAKMMKEKKEIAMKEYGDLPPF